MGFPFKKSTFSFKTVGYWIIVVLTWKINGKSTVLRIAKILSYRDVRFSESWKMNFFNRSWIPLFEKFKFELTWTIRIIFYYWTIDRFSNSNLMNAKHENPSISCWIFARSIVAQWPPHSLCTSNSPFINNVAPKDTFRNICTRNSLCFMIRWAKSSHLEYFISGLG